MKHKIKQIWYFTHWLLKDIFKNIQFFPTYGLTVFIAVISILFVDDLTGKHIIALVAMSMFAVCVGCVFNWIIIQPLKYKYEQYKQEQRDLLTIIKGD